MEHLEGSTQVQNGCGGGLNATAYGEGLDDQLLEWSSELFRNPQYSNRSVQAEHHWRVESAARTRAIIREQLRGDIEQKMAEELGLPANWRGNKLKSLEEWHEKMACLAKADAAPRCEHVFQDGTRCGSPRMKTGKFCYAHERMARVRPQKLNLLAMEDANSIMLNIMEINRALVDEEITEKLARILLYSQQLGLQALGKLTFQKTRPEEMVREEAEEVSRERTRTSTNEEEQGLTAKTAEGAEKEEEVAANQRRKAQIGEQEFTAKDAKNSRNGRQGLTAESAKSAKEEEQNLTTGDTEGAEKEEVAAGELNSARSVKDAGVLPCLWH